MDLSNFFPNISGSRVKNLFKGSIFKFPENLSITLTLLCTYKGSLPIGAPTSPVISNFICIEMDNHLMKYCKEKNITFSRYADDLTFSSDEYFTQESIEEIEKIISSHNFIINRDKFRIQNAQRQQTVTGIVVNEKLNVDRRYLKKVRAMLHSLQVNGLQKAGELHFTKLGHELGSK